MSDPMWSMQAEQPTSTVSLWEGQKESLGTFATGGRVSSAKYKITEDAVHFEAGLMSSRAETIPLWFVVDVDLHQTLQQRGRGVGDLTVKLDQAVAERYGQSALVLESIKDPKRVRELLVNQSTTSRRAVMERQHEREIQTRQAGASTITFGSPSSSGQAHHPATPPAASQTSLIDQLKELAQMRDSGILTDDEFAVQKTRLLA